VTDWMGTARLLM